MMTEAEFIDKIKPILNEYLQTAPYDVIEVKGRNCIDNNTGTTELIWKSVHRNYIAPVYRTK